MQNSDAAKQSDVDDTGSGDQRKSADGATAMDRPVQGGDKDDSAAKPGDAQTSGGAVGSLDAPTVPKQETEVTEEGTSEAKAQVMMVIPKLRNPTHFFEYSDTELDELLEKNKAYEIVLMRSSASALEVRGGQDSIDAKRDDLIKATIIPPLFMNVENLMTDS